MEWRDTQEAARRNTTSGVIRILWAPHKKILILKLLNGADKMDNERGGHNVMILEFNTTLNDSELNRLSPLSWTLVQHL